MTPAASYTAFFSSLPSSVAASPGWAMDMSRPEREAVTSLVESLSNQCFRSIHKKTQPLGFKPSFGGEGENTPKERRRMGTFVFTLLDNMQMTNSRFESLFNPEGSSTNEQ
jgi:hypothetical protein